MKRNHSMTKTPLAMAAGTMMAATVNAATVVNILAEAPSGTKSYSGAYTGDWGTYWNGASGSGTYSNLKASDGTTLTTISIQKSTGQGVSGGSSGSIGLFSGSNDYGNGGNYPFTIGGLNPSKTYDIYLYGYQSPSTYASLFHIDNGAPANRKTSGGSDGNTFVAGGLASDPYVTVANYVLFTGVAPDQSGNITGTWGVASGYGILNGFQIV
jgi:hypothetical protein